MCCLYVLRSVGGWSYTLKRQCLIWEISLYPELDRQLLSCNLGDLEELEVFGVFTGVSFSITLVGIVPSEATGTPSALSMQAQCDRFTPRPQLLLPRVDSCGKVD